MAKRYLYLSHFPRNSDLMNLFFLLISAFFLLVHVGKHLKVLISSYPTSFSCSFLPLAWFNPSINSMLHHKIQ